MLYYLVVAIRDATTRTDFWLSLFRFQGATGHAPQGVGAGVSTGFSRSFLLKCLATPLRVVRRD